MSKKGELESNKPVGEITAKKLKSLGIESPSIKGGIEIQKGLIIVPKKPFKTELQKQEFINKWTEHMRLNKSKLQKGGITSMIK